MKFALSNSKLATLLLVVGLALSVSALGRSEFIESAERKSEANFLTNLNDNEIDLGQIIFSWTREYWNGMNNGYNQWKKDYSIGNWCMAKDFQNEIGLGIFIGVFRTLTLQYLNIFQLTRDVLIAYDKITNQLIYCKGKAIADSTRFFIFDINIWFEIGAVLTAVLTNLGEFLAAIPLGLVNLFTGELRTLGFIHGTLLKHIFDAAKEFK
mmetsp:Transcript_12182/g.10802  ORF Transcript_12182/g.10802 Transcript_12182/m.10802 type:complete len:210 (+) Transcript_12182:39-668(+)